MKRYILLALLVVGCKGQSKKIVSNTEKKYPRVVHNKCIDKWAILSNHRIIQDGYYDAQERDCYVGLGIEYSSLDGSTPHVSYYNGLGDTIIDASLGHEITFNDSLLAARFMDSVNNIRQKEVRRQFISDSTFKSNDSIKKALYKCQHTYE